MRSFLVVLVCLFALLPSDSWAIRHLHPDAYPNAAHDQVRRPSAAQIRRFGSLRAAVASSAVGTKKVAVILVQFPSASFASPTGSRLIQDVVKIQNYFTQMIAYFSEVSYGKLTVQVKYFNSNTATPGGDAAPSAAQTGVYTLAHPMEYYGCGDEGVGCSGVTTPRPTRVTANGDYLLADAIAAARAGHTDLDTAHFDAVVVMHAGDGNETTRYNGDIWSIFYSQDPVVSAAGGGFEEGDIVPETESNGITSPLGVICHEFGHELGLPDLYNTGSLGGTSVVGNWEIMDSGAFTGYGANPAHFGAWAKYTLGWAVPSVITTKGASALGYVETGSGTNMLKLPVQNGLPHEYFLAEYRSPNSGATYDHNIPGEGLLIWHVDDDITQTRGVAVADENIANTVNTGSPHYGVSIVTADGISIGSNEGLATNAFANSSIFITPKSDNFNGEPSGVAIVGVSGVGGASVSFNVANLAVTPTVAFVSKLISFPNPAGTGYAHPLGEGHATLQFKLGRPATDYQINIYTLAGDLVRKIGRSDFEPTRAPNITSENRSGDRRWVYEYDWDLTNGNGEKVAPGVYLWLVRADGEKKASKLVVIR